MGPWAATRQCIWSLVALLALAGAIPTSLQAQAARDGLERCLERVMAEAREQDGRPAGHLAPVFLIAPDATQLPYTFPEDGCVGFLAVGRRQVQDLRLTLYAEDGGVFATAPGSGAFAYQRVCADSGTRLLVHVEVRDGNGEVRVLPVMNAPATLTHLDAIMAQCAAVGQPRAAPVDVGPEPIGAPLGQRLQQLSRELSLRGYRTAGDSLSGVLGSLRRELRSVTLPASGCSAVALVPDGDVEEVEVRILSGTQEGRLLDRALGVGRPAVVKVCADGQEQHMLDIRSYGRGGGYLLQVYSLTPPIHAPAIPGLDPVLRHGLWEALYRLSRVGMYPRSFEWVALPTRGEFRAPAQLSGEHCYAFAAIAADGISHDDVDLAITDGHDNYIAGDAGPGKAPLVFLCPTADGVYAAHLRAPDMARPTRALLIMAEPGPRP